MRMTRIPKYLLTKEVIVFKKEKLNEDGTRKLGPGIKYFARIEKYNREIYSKLGDTQNYNWVVYIYEDVNVNTDSNLFVINGLNLEEAKALNEEFNFKFGHDDENLYIGETFVIKNYDKHLHPDGTVHHTKLFLI